MGPDDLQFLKACVAWCQNSLSRSVHVTLDVPTILPGHTDASAMQTADRLVDGGYLVWMNEPLSGRVQATPLGAFTAIG